MFEARMRMGLWEIAMARVWWLVVAVMFFAGCSGFRGQPGSEPLGNDARRQLIDGDTPEQVLKLWGRPTEVRRGDYVAPANDLPSTLPSFDEQWVYLAGMRHRYVYFRRGKVVFAVEEEAAF
jgi:hypothetical protein